MEKIERSARIPAELSGRRADQALAALWPDFSRSRLQEWIRDGAVRLDGREFRPRDPVAGGETVSLTAELEPAGTDRPEALPLDILHEDEALLVLDKPAGMVVHPGAGNRAGTLVNALLHHAPGLVSLPRAGLVHRLDKDTTGLLVVAKTVAAHTFLVNAMQGRAIAREYRAVVNGVPVAGGRVDEPIGRHAADRTRMSVRPGGRAAVTHYRVLEKFRAHAFLAVELETGRTHQIRVHLAHIRHPLVGDPVYGRRRLLPKDPSSALVAALDGFRRQALHAAKLVVPHPDGGELSFEAPLPADMERLLSAMRTDADG